MRYQVDPTEQTQENGQKPRFLLIGSFKDAISWLLNDPALLPNNEHHLEQSKYAIWSRSNRPN